MKMLQADAEGDAMIGSCGGTMVVGVKLDSHSRELLTWAMVKVAQPGDFVIALHVLGDNEIVDRDGKSSLLSLVKAFDSILAVYEGFCNLKQVDLKLKICRGPSVRKVLVREAKAYSASKVILGAARKQHQIRSPVSVAKYCGRKLPKSCWVIAVNNGKVVYQRDGSSASTLLSEGIGGCRKNGLFKTIHRTLTLTKNTKVLSEGSITMRTKSSCSESCCENLGQALVKARLECLENVAKQDCSICSQGTAVTNAAFDQFEGEPMNDDGGGDLSMAIVPVQEVDAGSSLTSVEIKKCPEFTPGWPLLHRRILAERHSPYRFPFRKMSVVQWVMRLPSRHTLCLTNSDNESVSSGQDGDKSFGLNEESGAIVLVGTEAVITSADPENSSKGLPKELEGLQEKYSATCRLFSYLELLSATSNFLAENLVGKGGSSQVYKGCLRDGKELAVKILKPSEEMLKEFVLEIEIINTLHHKNIISLLGFCYEDGNLLLVYDFLSRGSLEENLHGKKGTLEFGWSERYKVALGVAEALDYLHNRNEQSVIHRDVKSSNILLSDDFEPQLSDFGLATWKATSSSHITCTDVAGTFGYLAPEYFMYGKVNDKIDVYAFGVVLLELLSGRKPISNDYPKGQESLVMWAKPILSGGKVLQLLDLNLGDNYDRDQLERMALAATLCIRRTPRTRPQISLVLKLLQGDAEVTKWARLQVTASEDAELLDDEASPRANLQSHLNVALLDIEDDSLSMSSIEQCVSLEDYLRGRWSRSSSFD